MDLYIQLIMDMFRILSAVMERNLIVMYSEAVITEMIAGLTIEKTADKQNWASGLLTYTITVTNGAEKAFENPVITDTLDPTLIKLVEDTVQVNGAKAIPLEIEAGLHTI